MDDAGLPNEAKTQPDGDVDLESTFDERSRTAQSPRRFPHFPAPPAPPPSAQLAGRTFEERYALGDELARGAMGRVLAAQDRAIGREVAIKMMLGLPSERAMARFERESRMTARLQHPGIIPVYEVGRCATGEPYIVMRLVHGAPMSERIAAAKTLPERLRLLPHALAAIDALAYAHEREIIHRDLKPHNVLLGQFGETVVIDWGLAKDLRAREDSGDSLDTDSAQSGDGVLTQDGAIVGTPAYMAPEQAGGRPADKRSDVYSLGAMLYHLLSGALPFQSASVHETLLKVIHGDHQSLEEREPALPTDLVTIVRCAMSLDPAARFASAREMAEELRRFQSGQLVSAHRYSTGELVKRWLRKNRLAVAVAALAAVALAVLGVISVKRVVAERDRANREAQTAKRVAEFLTGIFKDTSPSETRGSQITARELLDRAAGTIDNDLQEDPVVQANLMETMGVAYSDLGLNQPAEALYRKALAADLRALGPHAMQTLSAETQLSILLYQSGRYAEAEPMMRELVDERMRMQGPDSRQTLGAQGNLANLLEDTGHHDEAAKMIEDGAARRLKLFGPDDPDTITAQSNVISLYISARRLDLGIPLARQLLAVRIRKLGADDPQSIEMAMGLADILVDDFQYAEAEQVALQTLERARRVLGPEHPTTLNLQSTLGKIDWLQRRLPEAEKLLRETVDAMSRVDGSEHPDTLITKSRLAATLDAEGKLAEAIAVTEENLKGREKVFGPESQDTLHVVGFLGELYVESGRLAEGEPLILREHEGMLKALGPTDPETADALALVAKLRLAQGDEARGLELLQQALPDMSEDALRGMPHDPQMRKHQGDPRFAPFFAGVKSRLDKFDADRAARTK